MGALMISILISISTMAVYASLSANFGGAEAVEPYAPPVRYNMGAD